MLKTLVIGCGSIGERHVRCILHTKRVEVGICESNAALGRDVAGRYGVTTIFETLDAALDGHRWDLAIVAAPAHVHVPIATRLAECGIHLLIEKPLAVTFDGVDRLLDVVATNKIVASVAFVHRAHPVLTAFRAAMKSGRFGEPLQIVVNSGSDFAAARPAYRTIYYADRAKGGGAVQDALAHLLDLGLWLLGPIDRLECDVAHQKLDGVTVEDTVHLIGRHGSVLCCYSLNQYQAPTEITVTVVCSRGTMRYEVHNDRWLWTTEPGRPWSIEQFEPLARDDWFVRQAHAFLDAVEGKAPPLCSLADGVTTLRTTHAALASANRGLSTLSV